MRSQNGRISIMVFALAGATAPARLEADTAAPGSKKTLAAPLPRPLFETHFNSGTGKHVFKSREWDLSQVKRGFNAVIIDDGEPKLIDDVRAAGLSAIIEFDKKDDFAKGKSVQPTVLAIIQQVKDHPGTISAIRVADRVNQKLTPDRAIEYLKQTGGVFHREIPGVPILVDVEDWELTCGLRGQSSCGAHTDDEYRYCTNQVLQKIYGSGFVDGFELAVNLKNDDSDAMAKAMTQARKLFPSPFLLYSRTASLSFKEGQYPDDSTEAAKQVAAFIEAPLHAGFDGVDLWAWHRPWKTELRSFLNKDGSDNVLWGDMVRAYTAATSSASR